MVIAYFNAMIFDILSATGLGIFFLGLGFAIVAATAIKKPILFRVASFCSVGLAIFPLYGIFDFSGGFIKLNVGFYTYALGAGLCLIAGVIYKDHAKLQRRATEQLQQPIQTPQQMYVQYPGQKPQPINQKIPSTQRSNETMFCSNCGNQVTENDKFCEECGKNLSE
ncbi:unnamed protein product [marine sediment metagenome]|uniref:Zinc-ribbon domain-containing protein n=1 Tax=marine sediment metagenome TaxID=412755 RepID=X1CCL7_9ZZZZ